MPDNDECTIDIPCKQKDRNKLQEALVEVLERVVPAKCFTEGSTIRVIPKDKKPKP